MSTPVYSGGKDENGKDDLKLQPKINQIENGKCFNPYFPSPELIEAVRLAIKLKRPLLLEGESGCGKTRLADAIAFEFTQRYKSELKNGQSFWPYHIWNVKSVGRARDGLYTFDAVLRLRDAQMMGTNFEQLKKLDPREFAAVRKRLSDKTQYRKYGPLGKAILEDPEVRSILLIDEIDKADSDFPNDLLSELDRMGFDIPESGETFQRANLDAEPIIIITSNRERPLPEPFLRRCLYFYVQFPDEPLLRQIIERRFGDRASQHRAVLDKAITKFSKIRDLLDGKPGSKPPGTSEILEFLDVLLDLPEDRGMDILQHLAEAKQSPYLGILLKTRDDQRLYRRTEGVQEDG